MPKGNEFRITGTKPGESEDEGLHATMLSRLEGVVASDLMAAQSMIDLGFTMQEAFGMVLGPDAVKRLIRLGVPLM